MPKDTTTYDADTGEASVELGPTAPTNGRLTRDAILGAADITYEEVACPEWGGTVRVRALSGAQRAQWQQATLVTGANGRTPSVNFQQTTVRLVLLGVVDDDGRPLFTNADLTALLQKNSAPLERIGDVVMRLSGIGDDEREAISGNSPATPSDGSPTG